MEVKQLKYDVVTFNPINFEFIRTTKIEEYEVMTVAEYVKKYRSEGEINAT